MSGPEGLLCAKIRVFGRAGGKSEAFFVDKIQAEGKKIARQAEPGAPELDLRRIGNSRSMPPKAGFGAF